jgi:predicted Zn-dependent protease
MFDQRNYLRLMFVLTLSAVATQIFGVEATSGGLDLNQMKVSADAVLQNVGDVSHSQINAGSVFAYADALMASGQGNAAVVYLTKGLDLDPWRLDEQLVLANWYSNNKQAKKARRIFKYVLQFAEKESYREDALKGLGESSEKFIVEKAAAIPGNGPVVVLVPLGVVESWILEHLSEEINLDLGIPVSIMGLGIDPGPATRDPWSGVLNGIKDGVKKDAVLSVKILDLAKIKGIQEQNLWKDDTFVPLLLDVLKVMGKGDDAAQIEMLLAQVKGSPLQWDAAQLIEEIKKQSRPWARDGVVFVGVTSLDIGSDGLSFQFGISETGTALISYHRFTAEFNNETPNNLRLTRRLEKQALSSVGFTFGIVRCSTPWCARAYPNSLDEHDVKENKLCDQCREGFRKAFAKYGLDIMPPVKPQKHNPDL